MPGTKRKQAQERPEQEARPNPAGRLPRCEYGPLTQQQRPVTKADQLSNEIAARGLRLRAAMFLRDELSTSGLPAAAALEIIREEVNLWCQHSLPGRRFPESTT